MHEISTDVNNDPSGAGCSVGRAANARLGSLRSLRSRMDHCVSESFPTSRDSNARINPDLRYPGLRPIQLKTIARPPKPRKQNMRAYYELPEH
jgi:hypothetical protein